ncbi:hypothetical protein ACMYSN_17915 [Klebsiella sp. R445]
MEELNTEQDAPLVIVSNLSLRKRIVFISDNVWLSEGMRYKLDLMVDVIDFISFTELNTDVINCFDFNRDIIVYASRKFISLETLDYLKDIYSSKRKSNPCLNLDFVFVEPLLMHLFMNAFKVNRQWGGINFKHLEHRNISLNSIIHTINIELSEVSAGITPKLTVREVIVLKMIANQRPIREIAKSFQFSEKSIYRVRNDIAMKFNYSSFIKFYMTFIINSRLFFNVIKNDLDFK